MMVAINFKKDFVPIIENEEKRQTIRAKARCKVGDKLHLYTGQRTKACMKISDAICLAVKKIEISELATTIDGKELNPKQSEMLAVADGFFNHSDFMDFFRGQYGLPFNGVIIKWKLEQAEGE